MAAPRPRRHPFRPYVAAIFILLLAVSLPGFVRAQAPPPGITITDLGMFGGIYARAEGINNHGQIIGETTDTNENRHAIFWDNGTITTLGSVSYGPDAIRATDINDRGQVVVLSSSYEGGGHTDYRSWLWHNNTSTSIPGLHAALGINNQGHIVGFIITNCYVGECDQHAALWQNGTVIDLGTLAGVDSRATATNEQGQIVGWTNWEQQVFLWDNGSMIDLGTLDGMRSHATDINNQGQVVGWGETAAGRRHAVLWQHGTLTDLGTLGGTFSEAYAINEHGQVVGTSTTASGDQRAFLWQNGTMTDLGTLGGQESGAYDINEQGQIVGWSTTVNGAMHAIVWTIAQPTAATPREQIQAIKAQVKDLITTKVLNTGQGNALTTKLDGALAKLERGNKKAAANQMHAFVNQVNAFHKSRKLSTAQAQPLMDAANRIIAELRK